MPKCRRTHQTESRSFAGEKCMLKKLMRLAGAALCLLNLLAPSGRAADRPNIVLILLDDVGYSDYGCFGSEIQTPHIDSLAAAGVKFTQFYNNAICQPTRASLLTGLYPRYVAPSHQIRLTPEMLTIGELLQSVGYQTSLSGKWHTGS